jgi:hypothetical protein
MTNSSLSNEPAQSTDRTLVANGPERVQKVQYWPLDIKLVRFTAHVSPITRRQHRYL